MATVKDHSREMVGSWLKWDSGKQCYQWTGNGREHYIKCLEHQHWKMKGNKATCDCVQRSIGSNWWEWTSGSHIFHWRWPEEFATLVRDGQPHFQIDELPSFLERQRVAADAPTQAKIAEKVLLVRLRDYIEKGNVKSLTHMFSVLKGLRGIRMVYNGTYSGLNNALQYGLRLFRYQW